MTSNPQRRGKSDVIAILIIPNTKDTMMYMQKNYIKKQANQMKEKLR